MSYLDSSTLKKAISEVCKSLGASRLRDGISARFIFRESTSKWRPVLLAAGLMVIILLLLLIFIGRSESNVTQEPLSDTFTPTVGPVIKSITVSGYCLPDREVSLSPQIPGRVAGVNVQPGDRVQQGETLVQLETGAMQLDVVAAESALQAKEAILADLVSPPAQAEIEAVEAAVASRRMHLVEVLAGPSPEEIAVAEAELRVAEAELTIAEAQLVQPSASITEADAAAIRAELAAAEAHLKSVEIEHTRNPPADDIAANTALAEARERVAAAEERLRSMPQGPQLSEQESTRLLHQAAVTRRDAALAKLSRLQVMPSNAEIKVAQAELEQAKTAYARLLRGPTAEDLTIAHAEVEQAKLQLAQAKARLEAATLKAPFSGTITAVHAREGELLNGVAVNLLAPEKLLVVLFIDEGDVGRLSLNQRAAVTIDSLAGGKLEGRIVAIDLAPVNESDLSTTNTLYRAYLDLMLTDTNLQPGMAIKATVIVEQRDNVLRVPNEALHVDRANGLYSVYILANNTVQEVYVELGLRGDYYTEIVSGLELGDELANIAFSVNDEE
jgi:HlyD family secretion protein